MAEAARRLSARPWADPQASLAGAVCCSAPGLAWLVVFFLVPLGFLGYQSLQSGDFVTGYTFSWAFSNYWDAISTYHAQLIRSFVYAGIATVLRSSISYPLVYWIAFRGGRWKNLLLLFIIAPFFVTYLIRTLAWQTILADEGLRRRLPAPIALLGADGRLLATTTAVVAGITYNFLPFMALPLYVSLEQIDQRLLEAAKDLYASRREGVPARHAAALDARRLRRDAADLHPGRRRLHQCAAARHAEPVHDRERHPVEVPRADRLPGRGVALVRPDGD